MGNESGRPVVAGAGHSEHVSWGVRRGRRRPQDRYLDGGRGRRGHVRRARRGRGAPRGRSDPRGTRRHLRPLEPPARDVLRRHRRRDPRAVRARCRHPAVPAGPARHRGPPLVAGRRTDGRDRPHRWLRGRRRQLEAGRPRGFRRDRSRRDRRARRDATTRPRPRRRAPTRTPRPTTRRVPDRRRRQSRRSPTTRPSRSTWAACRVSRRNNRRAPRT